METEIEITDYFWLWDDGHPWFKKATTWLQEVIGPYRRLENDQLPQQYSTGYSYRYIGTDGIDCYYIVFYRASDAVLFKLTWMGKISPNV